MTSSTPGLSLQLALMQDKPRFTFGAIRPMAEFIYSTSYKRAGPWLVDIKALERLDEIIEQEYKRIMQAEDSRRVQEARESVISGLGAGETLSEEQLEKRIQKRLDPVRDYEKRRVIRLRFDDKTKLESSSIAEAKRHPDIENRQVKYLEIDLQYGRIECRLDLPEYGDELSLTVKPEKSAVARDVFVSFRDWARSLEAPGWLRYWSPALIWFVWIFAFWTSLGVVAVMASMPLRAKVESHQLLDKGIGKGDELKALTLLLSIESDYNPPGSRTTTNHWADWLAVGLLCALFICVLLSFKPKIVIAIGTGEAAIGRWRAYIKFVSWTLPVWIFLTFILPALKSWAELTFHLK